MRLLGTITHLQVQRSSLKVGPLGERQYTPEPLLAVPEVRVSPDGVTAVDAETRTIIDVHHRDHPSSKQARSGKNAISIGFTAHYAAMRERFGKHLPNGVAGENILVQTESPIVESDLVNGLVITTRDGSDLLLQCLIIAEPCVEFTRYAVQYPPDAHADEVVQEGLSFLRGGMRGFYATFSGEPRTVALGDHVFLPER